MRMLLFLFALIFASASVAAGDVPAKDSTDNWDIQQVDGNLLFLSKYKAPQPFSEGTEPAAIILLSISTIDSGMSLEAIVNKEVSGVHEGMVIADYLEGDFKPKNGVVTYYKDVLGQKIGFIKYRTTGEKNDEPYFPKTIIHGILKIGSKAIYSNLIVTFGEHQEEFRADQINILLAMSQRIKNSE